MYPTAEFNCQKYPLPNVIVKNALAGGGKSDTCTFRHRGWHEVLPANGNGGMFVGEAPSVGCRGDMWHFVPFRLAGSTFRHPLWREVHVSLFPLPARVFLTIVFTRGYF